MGACYLEKTAFDDLLRHVLAVDADCVPGRANSVQHDFHDFIKAFPVVAVGDDVVLDILQNHFSVAVSFLHHIHPSPALP